MVFVASGVSNIIQLPNLKNNMVCSGSTLALLYHSYH